MFVPILLGGSVNFTHMKFIIGFSWTPINISPIQEMNRPMSTIWNPKMNARPIMKPIPPII